MAEKRIVGRYEKVNYLKVSDKWLRMQGFTDMSKSQNAQEYSRRYVDEKSERTDIVGVSAEIGFAFDYHLNDEVHATIAKIFDDELIGAAAVVEIVTVDFTSAASGNSFKAISRKYAVSPDGEGDSTDAYTYSGTFKAQGDATKGNATLDESKMSVTAFQATPSI